jgi:hypothetical protein
MGFRKRLLILFALLLLTGITTADDATKAKRRRASWLLPMPGIKADKAIPTSKQILGHNWGRDISNHSEITRYLQALVKAAPGRCKLVKYGSSYEKRDLYYLVISSPENIKNLAAIKKNNKALAQPRKVLYGQSQEMIKKAPAIVWLAYSVHGNEISSSDAALLTAYHLVAARDKKTKDLLGNTVVIIDPLQNPDGRDRFVNVFRETRGQFQESNPDATEHVERWPGGRSNHYYFDMNRDWFRHSQKETQAKVKAFLDWYPQIYVDAHEMGRNSSYFFVPPTDPINPYILPSQRDWFMRIGKHQGARFDQFGFDYTTREVFDAFYPGYGSEWPTLQGGIGVLWEQASARGLVIDRDDETKLYYHDGVRNHYISGLATIEIASKHRKKLLSDFYDARWRGIQLGLEGEVKHFFLLESERPGRAAKLAGLLHNNGLEVRRLSKPVKIQCRESEADDKSLVTIPPGAYHILVAQPGGRLIRTLLDAHVPMDKGFIKRQKELKKKELPGEIYDVTAWSLPLAFDVPCLSSGQAVAIKSQLWTGQQRRGKITGVKRARIAYLLPGNDDGALVALSDWLKKGLRVHVAEKPLTLNGQAFPRGTLIVKVRGNPKELSRIMEGSARRFHVDIHGTNSSFVSSGAHFGGPSVHWVKPPKILLVTDHPSASSSGHTWYLFDQVLSYPTTRVAGRSFGAIDLAKYNVLIIPDGRFKGARGFGKAAAARIKAWVRKGGTLILLKNAARWAMDKEIGLLSAKRALHPNRSGKGPGKNPDSVAGSFFRSTVNQDHWLTYSFQKKLTVFFSGSLLFDSMIPDQGRNLVTFAPSSLLLASGFCWDETLKLAAGKSFMVTQDLGRGHVVAFADDPNYRAMYPPLQRLFMNATFFGPGH